MSVRIAGGTHRGRRIRSVRRPDLRPTSERVRSAIFSILGQRLVDGVRVLDLYAGTGALGIEAISRGAGWADFVELNARLCRQLRENLAELSLDDRGRVYQTSVDKVLDVLDGGYDLVFADPPYDVVIWDTVIEHLGRSHLVEGNGVVVVEHRSGASGAERYGRLVRETVRRYGDSSVSIYRAGAVSG